MKIKVQKWGNSAGVRIPKPFLKEMNVQTGEEIELKVKNGQLILEKSDTELEDLLNKIIPENCHGETPTGPVTGNEIW